MLDKQPRLRRLLWVLCGIAITWFATLFVYGFVSFPFAPYKPCGTGAYCDKGGQLHSVADYESFSRWETLFKLSCPFGFVAGVLAWRLRGRNR
ncbi:hypothetical protein [Roseateles sp.]|uniref:hypothetical protein n=1 Tax=Roseateles sp. TaxID=1971397 RepID=UPI0032631967